MKKIKSIAEQIQNMVKQQVPQKNDVRGYEYVDFNKSIQEMLETKFPLSSDRSNYEEQKNQL